MIEELGRRAVGLGEWAAVLIPLIVVAYFAPILIAIVRGHRFSHAIGALNVLLGWTGVGWIAALIWAVNKDVSDASAVRFTLENHSLNEPSWSEVEVEAQPASVEAFKKCRYCAEIIKAEAIVCRFCGRDLETAPADAHLAGSALDSRNVEDLYRLLIDGESDEARAYQENKFQEVFDQARIREEEAQLHGAPGRAPGDAASQSVAEVQRARIVNLEPTVQEDSAPKARKRYAGRSKA